MSAKRHWRAKSRIEDIEAGLADLVKVVRELGIRSIALPPLGAGLGGLAWDNVRNRIEKALSTLSDVRVIVFKPQAVLEADPDLDPALTLLSISRKNTQYRE